MVRSCWPCFAHCVAVIVVLIVCAAAESATGEYSCLGTERGHVRILTRTTVSIRSCNLESLELVGDMTGADVLVQDSVITKQGITIEGSTVFGDPERYSPDVRMGFHEFKTTNVSDETIGNYFETVVGEPEGNVVTHIMAKNTVRECLRHCYGARYWCKAAVMRANGVCVLRDTPMFARFTKFRSKDVPTTYIKPLTVSQHWKTLRFTLVFLSTSRDGWARFQLAQKTWLRGHNVYAVFDKRTVALPAEAAMKEAARAGAAEGTSAVVAAVGRGVDSIDGALLALERVLLLGMWADWFGVVDDTTTVFTPNLSALLHRFYETSTGYKPYWVTPADGWKRFVGGVFLNDLAMDMVWQQMSRCLARAAGAASAADALTQCVKATTDKKCTGTCVIYSGAGFIQHWATTALIDRDATPSAIETAVAPYSQLPLSLSAPNAVLQPSDDTYAIMTWAKLLERLGSSSQ